MDKQKQGNTILIVLLIVGVVGVGGVAYFLLSDGEKDATSTSSIPVGCQAVADDACELFSCMALNCWCKDDPSGGVVYEGGTTVQDENAAKEVVSTYLTSINSEYSQVVSAVKLNGEFFNVFVETDRGNEEAFTVSKDGEVLVTICGV